MIGLLDKAKRSDTGELDALPRPSTGIPSSTTKRGGIAVDDYGRVYTETGDFTASDVKRSGWRLTHDGAIYVTNSAKASDDVYDRGLRLTSGGRLALTAGSSALDRTKRGLRVDQYGTVYATSSFDLPMADLGAGVVDTTLRLGVGSATFTRATAAWTRLSTGLWAEVASGSPRSYYLSDGTYAGYLAEGARTNICLQSNDWSNASWTKTDTTVTADSIVSPDGAQNADLLTEGTAGTAATAQTITGTADANYAVSRFFKRGNTDWVCMRVNNGVNLARAWFNLATGVKGSTAVGGTAAAVSSSMEDEGDGWYRCTFVASVGSGATAISLQTHSASADASNTRVNNATRYEWMAQFENNVSFVSTPIPTTTASVTRNADVLSYTFAGNALAAAGAWYAEMSSLWSTSSGTHVALGTSTTGTNTVFVDNGNADTRLSVGDGTQQANKTGMSGTSTGVRKRAASWGSNLAITGDGLAVATATFDGTIGSTALGIGCYTNGNAPYFGTFKNVRIWQRQLSDSVLQSLTA